MRADNTWKGVVIDGKGHLLGRLASIVAKMLLRGENVVVVRCEGINISGSYIRNRLKYMKFLRKRTLTNPQKGPFHWRSPHKMFWRVVRGMLPKNTKRGKAAHLRLKTFDGIPSPWSTKKRMVAPEALKVIRLNVGRDFTTVGAVAASVGWKYEGIVQKLEEKRKERSKSFYQKKNELRKIYNAAKAEVDKSLPLPPLGMA